MERFTKHDLLGAMLIDGGVLVVLILGIVTWAVVSGDAYTRAMAWDDLMQGSLIALASGPLFILISKLMDKAESEAL